MKIYKEEKFLELPEAVFLDLDNTLYSYDSAHSIALGSVKKKLVDSLSISSKDFDFGYSTAREEVKKSLTGTAASHSRLLYFQRMLEYFGLKSQPLLVLDLEQTYWRSFLNGANIFEGVERFLDRLRLLGIQTAVVTDLTSQIQLRKIIYFRLDQLIDFVVSSEEVGVDKPHEAVFRVALAKTGVSGEAVWMIGDSTDKDIRGAREAIGATTIQKIHKGVKVGTGSGLPDASIRDFSELEKFLSKFG